MVSVSGQSCRELGLLLLGYDLRALNPLSVPDHESTELELSWRQWPMSNMACDRCAVRSMGAEPTHHASGQPSDTVKTRMSFYVLATGAMCGSSRRAERDTFADERI